MAMPWGGRPLVTANFIPAARKAEDGLDGALGEDFFLGDEGAVNIGDDQANRFLM